MNAITATAKAANRNARRWDEAADTDWLLDHVGAAGTDRKLRLFAVACCRDIWHLLTDERSRAAVETAERFADGLVAKKELAAARDAAWDARAAAGAARAAARAATGAAGAAGAAAGAAWDAAWAAAWAAKRKHFAHLFRDIFGNPFRPIAFDPRWRTSTVVDLARTFYDDRAYELLPILADALMDAGCDSEEVIAHCGGGPHVRGCWVVDGLLGRK